MSADEDEMKEMVGGCCVCSDERGWDENPLVYCDGQGCNVAVHQACYGIVTVPSGPWFCRKCESHERSRGRCDLCPSKDGAIKRTDQNGWAHVVCALYIPEVRFGNVTTMEPILISLIPSERFGKPCYICQDHNRGSKSSVGACMTCNKQGCKQNFHVTCAQMQGLLCEEAGNMDNVKYCGYCQHHYGKLMKNYNSMLNSSQKSTRNVKIIPPFRPVPALANTESPGSSPEKSGSKSGLNDDSKNSSAVLSSLRSSTSTPSNNNPGDSTAGGKGQANSSNISPDINSCSKSSKNSKKGSSGHSGASSKSGTDSTAGKIGSSSIIPKIAQPILTPASFSSTGPSKILTVEEKTDSTTQGKGRGTPHGKPLDNEQASPVKCDDNLIVKLERVDEKNSPLKGSVHGRKDLTTLELKEVVTAALDRPMTSTGNKYDHVSSALTGGIEPPMSSTGSVSSQSSRHSHGEKPAPPDIKPHVTLTPIPMRGSTTRMSLSRAEEAREEREKEAKSKDKSPVGSLSFHNSFGPPKLHSQTQQSSPDTVDSTTKVTKPPDLSQQNELPPLDKAGPPSKRARGASRDEDRVERKTPTKGRGGRRGAANSNYNSKREISNGSVADENSHEDPMEGNAAISTRGGRSGPGRKPGSSRISGRPPADDSPAPTLAQLKSQMEASGDSPLSALPPHMFGNALNPASSMAQRMVDTLSQEMEAVVAAGGVPDIGIILPVPSTPVVGISLPGKANTNTPPVNGASTSSTASHVPASAPQTLEQLLERQWEQGSQFLMEQAQHLDIAQLLSCLNQLKQDNRALEEHVQSLVQRRDQLIAINARLSIPLGNNTTLAPLGTGFNSSTNGNNQNGHGTPPPTLQPQTMLSSTGQKGLQVSSSTLSPQQQHDMMMQHGRHSSRDDRSHPHSSEMQVSRAEIGSSHSSQNPHGHSHHPPLNQRGQGGSSYGSYSGHPGVASHPSSHPHPHPSHHSSRDSTR